MPIEVDIFKTRAMLAVYDEMDAKNPKKYITRNFFPTSPNPVDGQTIDIDIIKGARRVAPFVNPTLPGKPVESLGYETKTIKPPYIKMLRKSDAYTLMNRRPGESIYRPPVPPVQLAAEKLAEELEDASQMVHRRIEVMAAEAIRTGKITVIGEGLNAVIDFQRDTDHSITLSGTDLWDNAASDPTEDILDWKHLINQATGLNANRLMLGFLALKAFLKNQKVRDILDNRRLEIGNVSRQELPDGVIYYGNIHGVDILSYNDWYIDTDGTEKPMIPDKEAVMACTNAPNSLHYCSILDVEAGLVNEAYFPKTWVIPNPSAMMLLVQSSPIIILRQPDSTVKAQVLA